MVEQLPGEIDADVIQWVTSWQKWRRARMHAALNGDRATWQQLGQLRKAAVELAFKKHQLARKGSDPKTEKEIEHHRQQLTNLPISQFTHLPIYPSPTRRSK